MSATAGCRGTAVRRSFRGRLRGDVRTSRRQVKRWRRFRSVPFLALLAGASGARVVETCEGTPDYVFGEFIGFALICDCAGTDPDETAPLWDQTAAAQTRLVETLCHLNPARPECREAD